MNTYSNLFVRPSLTATNRRITDPLLLVDLWLDDFLRLDWELDRSCWFEVLSLYGRLSRVRPRLLKATGLFDAWKNKSEQLQGSLPKLAEETLNELDPCGWLEEAQQLADACDEGLDAADLSEWAESLLVDLDDAELIIWAAEKAGLAEEQWTAVFDQVTECVQWLKDNCDRFFPAGVFIQAIAQTFRPNLDEFDIGLASSTVKFVLLLDALEEAEQILYVPKSKVVPASAGYPWNFLPQMTYAMAAEAAKEPAVKHLRWWSPDGLYRAVLAVPRQMSPAEPLILNFLRDDMPASDLVGEPVWLGGLPSVIDPEGRALLNWQKLSEQQKEHRHCVLVVGDPPETWLVEGTS